MPSSMTEACALWFTDAQLSRPPLHRCQAVARANRAPECDIHWALLALTTHRTSQLDGGTGMSYFENPAGSPSQARELCGIWFIHGYNLRVV